MGKYTHTFERVRISLKKSLLMASVLSVCAITSSLAVAAPINNASFGIGGAFTLPTGSNLGNTNSIFISNGGMIVVSVADTMDLAGLVNLGQFGSLKDIPSISGFSPISNFISIGSGVTVDLGSLQIVNQIGPLFPGFAGFINLSGNAVIHATGYDPTPGVLTFTGTSSDNRTFTLAVTTSATTVQQVAEPLSLGLLGVGLLGLFGIGRRTHAFRHSA